MPRTLHDIRAKWPADQRKAFDHFVLERAVAVESPSGVNPDGIFKPHLGIRPTEYFLQRRFSLFPTLPHVQNWYAEAAQRFPENADSLALGMWIDACLGKWRDKPAVAEVLELWVLDRWPKGIADAAAVVVREILSTATASELPPLSSAASSCVNLLASGHLGNPDAKLLAAVIDTFNAHCDERNVMLSPTMLALGSLLWRAFDSGLLDETAMRRFLDIKPILFRTVDSDFYQAGLRVTAAVPENSPSERLIEEICLARLDAISDAQELHVWGGPIKSIPLWPGRDVFLRTVQRLDETRYLAKNDFQDTLSSSLWHILRHTRTRSADRLSKRDLAGLSERTLIWAAMVAPWWAGEIERAMGWNGFENLVTWVFGHPESAMGSSDRTYDLPRVERQIAGLVRNRGYRPIRDRNAGIFERHWLCHAIAQLGDERAAAVIGAMPLAWKHRTYLADAAQAILGLNAEQVWAGAEEGRQMFVKLLGLLPGTDIDRRLAWFREFWLSQEKTSQQRRLVERRAAVVGATNLSETVGVGDPVLLALDHGRASVEPQILSVPMEFDKHRLELDTDIDGSLRPVVVRYGRKERALRGVPREIADRLEFKSVRHQLRDLSSFDDNLVAVLDRRMMLGREISGAQMQEWLHHPIARERLHRLVFLQKHATGEIEGMPVWAAADDATITFETIDGSARPILPDAQMQLLHPLQLKSRGSLEAWRDMLVKRRLRQPFAQLFRSVETPAMNPVERCTTAYAGRIVNTVAMAERLGRSGWEIGPGQPLRRVFRDAGMVAHWPFLHPSDPSDTLQFSRATTGELFFSELGSDARVAVDAVPTALLSDIGRDCVHALSECAADGKSAAKSLIESRREIMQRLVALHGALVEAERVEASVGQSRVSVRVFVEEPKKSKSKKASATTGAAAGSKGGGQWVVFHIDLADASVSFGPTRITLPPLPEPDEPVFLPDPPSATLMTIADHHARLVHAGNFERRALMEFIRQNL